LNECLKLKVGGELEVRECADKLQAMSRHGGGLVLASALAYNYYSGTQNIKLDGRERGGFRGRGCKELSSEFYEKKSSYTTLKAPYSRTYRLHCTLVTITAFHGSSGTRVHRAIFRSL